MMMVDLDRVGHQEHDPHPPTDGATSSEHKGTHNETASNRRHPREIRHRERYVNEVATTTDSANVR